MKRYKERVELHCHTTMSKRDGVASPKSIISFVKEQGMPAVAITDHGNVLGFQELPYYLEKNDNIKVIYGMEGYVVDDINPIFSGKKEDEQKALDSDIVVFDVETTGFSPLKSKVIELAAVKIHNGILTDEFHCYINPGIHIPERLQDLIGIDDSMVTDARRIEEVLPEFLEFIGDSVLVASNAPFCCGFLKENAKRIGRPFDNSRIDTVNFSRCILKEINRHTLYIVAKALDIELENKHRLGDRLLGDAKITAEIYIKLVEAAKELGLNCLEDLNKLMENDEEACKKLPTFHTTILAKNDEGRKALYELVSMSNLKYFNRRPRIPLSEILSRRANLLIGSGCEAGFLGKAIRGGKAMSEIEEIAAIYDFLEVQPINENLWMIDADDEDTINSIEDIRAYNQVIIDLGDRLNIPVVAISDVHFLRPENAICRRVMMCEMGFEDYNNQNNLYFRTTEEMLAEFDYLGKEKAVELVIENTNAIAEKIDKLEPIPKCKLSVCLPEADKRLSDLCMEGLCRKYGENRRRAASERLEKELKNTFSNGFSSIYLLWYELLQRNNLKRSQYFPRGLAAGSIICYLLDISHVDPLDKELPLYYEFFQGFDGNKEPDIDLNVDGKSWKQAIDLVKFLPGLETAIRGFYHITAYDYDVDEWIGSYEKREHELSDSDKHLVQANCQDVLMHKGWLHPAKIFLIPEGVKITDYVPMDMDEDREEEGFHFSFHYLDYMFLNFDILPSVVCSFINQLEELTGYYPSDQEIRSEEIISLFTGASLAGIDENEYEKENGKANRKMLDVPGFCSQDMMDLLDKLKPKTYADLVKVYCLCHGTGVWTDNAQKLLVEGKADVSTIIASREDVFESLISYGLDRETAFTIAEYVRKGKMAKVRMDEKYREIMVEHGVPDWFIWSCERILYLYPRACGAENVMMGLRCMYYKVHYPEVCII